MLHLESRDCSIMRVGKVHSIVVQIGLDVHDTSYLGLLVYHLLLVSVHARANDSR